MVKSYVDSHYIDDKLPKWWFEEMKEMSLEFGHLYNRWNQCTSDIEKKILHEELNRFESCVAYACVSGFLTSDDETGLYILEGE